MEAEGIVPLLKNALDGIGGDAPITLMSMD